MSRTAALVLAAGAGKRFGGQKLLADLNGTPVLQATRQAVVTGPGSITSDGGCREPAQAGSTCEAPGRN